MQLPDLQAHQPQQDVQPVSLLLGLGEKHHVVGEGSRQQSWKTEASQLCPSQTMDFNSPTTRKGSPT